MIMGLVLSSRAILLSSRATLLLSRAVVVVLVVVVVGGGVAEPTLRCAAVSQILRVCAFRLTF